MDDGTPDLGLFWNVFGIVGTTIFFARFYVQWFYSEWKGRSEMPPLFWYQSAVGSVMLLVYAIVSTSPLGALSQSINLLPYSRNLIFIWRDQGRLNRRLYIITHVAAFTIMTCGIAAVIWLWWREYLITKDDETDVVRQTWFWLAVGAAGQALFGSRFLIQWIATELNRKSIVPTIFWYISLVASALLAAAYLQRGEWYFASGTIATMPVYIRNLWLIHTRPAIPEAETPVV